MTLMAAQAHALLEPYAVLERYLESLQARPGFQRAFDKTGGF